MTQFFLVVGFVCVSVTGRRRALWSLYNVVLMISYQGLLSTSLDSNTLKFMWTVSRFSILPNFFNPILSETLQESIDEANLSNYGTG
jgi:hypothetical protein